MKNKFLKGLVASIALVVSGMANAGLIFSDNGANTTFTVTEDIEFIATGSSDNITRFIFEDAYSVAPGVQTVGVLSNSIGIQVNGIDWSNPSAGSVWGPLSFNLNEWDMNDFGISFYESFGFGIGDIVTLTAGTAVLNISSALKPDLMPTSVLMVSNAANALSGITDIAESSVPEPTTSSVPAPSTLAIFIFGLVGLASRKFKK